MRNFYLLALLWLMALSAYGQKMKTAVADKYYEDYQFLAAAQAYERIIKSDAKNVAVMEKLVHCYTRLNDPVKSEFWLSKVLKSPQPPVKSFKTFGTLLAANGKYEEASLWFGKSYQETRDEESLRWLNTYRNLQQFYADSALYQISKVTFNSRYSDFSPTFYQEGVVFSSARDNGKVNKMKFDYNNTWFIDLYFVKDTLARPVPFSEVLNSKYHEGPLSFTPDQKTVYFTRNNHLKKSFFSSDGVSKLKIYYASVYNGRWGQVREFNLNNREYSVGQPALASDNLMYFVSDMPGGFGGTDLYRTEKVNDVWQKPVNLGPEINTSGNEMFPFVGEGNMLYFASSGHPGLGGLDVFYTAVSGRDFSAVTNVGYPVNTARDDFGFIIRNNHGYFSSNRDGKTTHDDIYRFKVSQNHPVVMIAREQVAPVGADSLALAQGNEAALALATGKDAERTAAKPGEQEAGEADNKLQAATGESPAGNPAPGDLAATGTSANDQLRAPEGQLLAAPANTGQPDPEEENRNTFELKQGAGAPETAVAGQQAASSQATDPGKGADFSQGPASPQDSASRERVASGASQAPALPAGDLAEKEAVAGSRIASRDAAADELNTNAQEKEARAWSGVASGKDAVSDSAAQQNAPATTNTAEKDKEADALAENAANDNTPVASKSSSVGSTASAHESAPEAVADNPSGQDAQAPFLAAIDPQRESLSGSSAQENADAGSVAAGQRKESEASAGLTPGENTMDSQKGSALQDLGQSEAEKPGLEDKTRETGLGQSKAGTQSELAGEDTATSGSEGSLEEGERSLEEGLRAGEGSLLASGTREGEAGQPDKAGDSANEAGEAGQPGKINRVKSLAKEFKTGSIGEIIELEILYDLDRTTIRPDAAHKLNGLVAYMKRNPYVKVELAAHTDVRGSDAYNERLSQGRAESVVDYLARHGISRNRLVPVGFGEKDLAISAASSEAEHQVNRRTTAKIFANEALLAAYHETVTQPKLAAIRAQKESDQASRLAATFPLFPDNSPDEEKQDAAGEQPASGRNEGLAGATGNVPEIAGTSNEALTQADTALPEAGSKGQLARSTRLLAAAEDGVSFEEEAPAPAPAVVYTREMLFWNPNATDPKTAAAQAKKNPDTFFIISNAFLSLVEAEWYLQEVMDLGGDGRIIMPFAGSKLYRVAVAGYNRYSEAERQLPGKKQVFGAHSWILGLNSREFALRRVAPETAAPDAVAAVVSAPGPAASALPAMAGGGNTLLASANALIATLERRIDGLETRLATAEAGAVRRVKAAVQAPKILYDKVMEANRHRASARLWAEVAPHTIDEKTGRAYIISGSFSTLGSANWYRKKMARMGGESRIILPNASNRLYQVTVADYTSRTEARQKLLSLKRTFGLYIWILDY